MECGKIGMMEQWKEQKGNRSAVALSSFPKFQFSFDKTLKRPKYQIVLKNLV